MKSENKPPRISVKDSMGCRCRYLGENEKECKILKRLYCVTEPKKACTWFKAKEDEKQR